MSPTSWIATAAALFGIGLTYLYYLRVRGLQRRLDRLTTELAATRKRLAAADRRRPPREGKRRDHEDNLRRYLQLLDVLINTIPNPIYFTDTEGVIQGCNPAFAGGILNLSNDRLLGKRLCDLGSAVPPEMATVLDRLEDTVSADPPSRCFEFALPCADGTTREYLFNTAAVRRDDGTHLGTVAVMADLTARNQAARDHVQREKFKGVLETAGAVCHELNQPLQVISGYAEMALSDAPPGHPFHEAARQMNAQVERMVEITRKLQQLTFYETLDYDEQSKIIDIHRASECRRENAA